MLLRVRSASPPLYRCPRSSLGKGCDSTGYDMEVASFLTISSGWNSVLCWCSVKIMYSRDEKIDSPWIQNHFAGVIPRMWRVKPWSARTGGEGGSGFCVFVLLPRWLSVGTGRFPSWDVGTGVEGVALEQLEDTGVVWDRVFCEWESCVSDCEKGEFLVSWRRCLGRNRHKLKVWRRIRPCSDRLQRYKRAAAVMQRRPQCGLRTHEKFWCAKIGCSKEKQIPHKGKRHAWLTSLRHVARSC